MEAWCIHRNLKAYGDRWQDVMSVLLQLDVPRATDAERTGVSRQVGVLVEYFVLLET